MANLRETKTGQGLDSIKLGLLAPAVVECILHMSGLQNEISLIDIGAGDGASSQRIVMELLASERPVKNYAVVEPDRRIYSRLAKSVTERPISSIDTLFLQSGHRDLICEILPHFEETYNVALSQLVMHQIENDHEASHLMHFAYRMLKPNGNLLLVNLHPQYLHYLANNEPDKFEVKAHEEGMVIGTYKFDSSGTTEIYSRSIETQAAMCVALGYDPIQVTPISTEAIAEQKPRYAELARLGIPMFYLMHLRKNPDCFVSGTEGVVEAIQSHGANWIAVHFVDDEEVVIPAFRGWKQVESGSHLLLHETRTGKLKKNILNFWTIDSHNQIKGGKFITT